jgi:DNA-directed RNA polymerase beta' subunit
VKEWDISSLPSPVSHIWFLKSLPSRLGMVLDMTLRDIERVLYFEAYVVTDPGMTTSSARCQLLTEDDYLIKTEEYGDDFSASMGAEGIRDLLSNLDIVEIENLRARWKDRLRNEDQENFQTFKACLKHSINQELNHSG